MITLKKFFNQQKRKISLFFVLCIYGVILSCIYLIISIANGESDFGYQQLIIAGSIWFILIVAYLLLLYKKRNYIKNWIVPAYLEQSLTTKLILAVWFGLLSGFAQLALVIYQKYYRNYPIYQGADVAWYWAVGEIIILGVAGLLLHATAKRWALLGNYSTTIFLYSFLVALSFLLSSLGIAEYAAIILSLGLASLCARILNAFSSEYLFIVYHTLGWLWLIKDNRIDNQKQDKTRKDTQLSRHEFLASSGALIGGVIVASLGVDRLFQQGDHQQPSTLPNLPHRPNILLVVMDTVRAQNTSLHGYQRSTTPFLEQFAQESVFFERAISPSPWTLPAHASLFTGYFPNQLSANWLTPLDIKYPTLAEVLLDQGYSTAAFIGNLKYCSREFGLARGFLHFEDYETTLEQILIGSNISRRIRDDLAFRSHTGLYRSLVYKDAGQITRDFLKWSISQPTNRPFFAFLNYYDAHDPYAPPIEYAKKFSPIRPNGLLNVDDLDIHSYNPAQLQDLLDAYDGSIAYIDANIRALISNLREKELLDQTLVIIVSDHGEHFGDHQLLFHGNSLYTQLIHVPLLLRLPEGTSAGVRVNYWISLQDLPATILDIVGTKGQNILPGQTLRHHLSGVTNSRSDTPINSYVDLYEGGWMKSTIVDGMHFILTQGGKQELYDLNNDLFEEENLADSDTGKKIISELLSTMERTFPAP
jgi:arylsulfatase A-like enzyme